MSSCNYYVSATGKSSSDWNDLTDAEKEKYAEKIQIAKEVPLDQNGIYEKLGIIIEVETF